MAEDSEKMHAAASEKQVQNGQTPSAPDEHAPKKKHPRRGIIVGVVVVVIALAGVGFYQWHETPGFCAAFCHNMDQYLDTYSQPQGVQGVDKYGNTVSNTNAIMSTLHRHNNTTGKSDIACMDCHHAVVGEQVSEGISWIGGNYLSPLDERVGGDLTAWWKEPDTAFCANENCHAYLRDGMGGIDYDRLEASTSWMSFNPHSQHHADIRMTCTDCHKGHRASVQMCTGCHTDAEIPDGWITYQENLTIMANSGTQVGTTQISEAMVS